MTVMSRIVLEPSAQAVVDATSTPPLICELAVGAGAALLFVEYPNAPEARYPVAIEQGYATAQWVIANGAGKRLDPDRVAVAGEPVGGNIGRADAHGQGARRCRVRPRRHLLPRHGRRDGHGLVRRVRRGLLNAMSEARATRAAIAQAVGHLQAAFGH